MHWWQCWGKTCPVPSLAIGHSEYWLAKGLTLGSRRMDQQRSGTPKWCASILNSTNIIQHPKSLGWKSWILPHFTIFYHILRHIQLSHKRPRNAAARSAAWAEAPAAIAKLCPKHLQLGVSTSRILWGCEYRQWWAVTSIHLVIRYDSIWYQRQLFFRELEASCWYQPFISIIMPDVYAKILI